MCVLRLHSSHKPDGVNPSFMGPLLRALDEDDAQKAAGHILFLTQARKTDAVLTALHKLHL